jgi:hypothetical protein
MSATEADRAALREAARATLGEKEGDTLMAVTAPANTTIATRQDVERATESLRAEMSVLEARIRADLATAANRMLVQTIVVGGTFQAAAVGFLTLTLR